MAIPTHILNPKIITTGGGGMDSSTAMRLVRVELGTKLDKFPVWPTDPLHAVAILAEEVGELTKAIVEHTYETHKADRACVRLRWRCGSS